MFQGKTRLPVSVVLIGVVLLAVFASFRLGYFRGLATLGRGSFMSGPLWQGYSTQQKLLECFNMLEHSNRALKAALKEPNAFAGADVSYFFTLAYMGVRELESHGSEWIKTENDYLKKTKAVNTGDRAASDIEEAQMQALVHEAKSLLRTVRHDKRFEQEVVAQVWLNNKEIALMVE